MADRHITEKITEGESVFRKVTLFAKVTILPGDEPVSSITERQKRTTSYPAGNVMVIMTRPSGTGWHDDVLRGYSG